MKTQFKEMGGSYRQEGDYLLPSVEAPESPAIGVWGQRRHKYLMEHNHALYTALFLSSKLTDHLEEINRVATKMFDRHLILVIVIAKPSWINCTKPTPNPTNPTRRKSAMDSKNWKNISAASLWKIITLSSTSVAAYAQLTSMRLLSMACNMAPI